MATPLQHVSNSTKLGNNKYIIQTAWNGTLSIYNHTNYENPDAWETLRPLRAPLVSIALDPTNGTHVNHIMIVNNDSMVPKSTFTHSQDGTITLSLLSSPTNRLISTTIQGNKRVSDFPQHQRRPVHCF